MHILYVSQYFPPEMGAPAARVSELARHWARLGHRVTVLTGFPNHPTGVVPPAYRRAWRRGTTREWKDGVAVVRTWLYPAPNRLPRERILNYTSFFVSACLRGLALDRPDVVIGTSPQLLVGLAAWWIARAKRCPFVFEVRDLWPESLVASGIGRQGSPLIRSLDRLAMFLYRRADRIVVVTEAFKEYLVERRRVPPGGIEVVENGVETDIFTPDADGRTVREELGLNGRFVVSYIGTLGYAHGLDVVLEAARRLKEAAPEVTFLLVGEGADRERLEALRRARGVDNVCLIGAQPREGIPRFISASDVCLVVLRPAETFTTVLPSKMLEFMACGRPVILAVDGQARRVLERAQAGVVVPPGDPAALAQAVTKLSADPGLRATLGEYGRAFVELHYQRRAKAEAYVRMLEAVMARPRNRRPAKRMLDVALSGLGLLASAPLALLIALAIKLEDGGPILYGQERVGRDGRRFRSWKFRSMVPDSDDRFGPLQAGENDRRVTRIGRLLRATALDELPQLWNILKGDMSFVGPRALMPAEIEVNGNGELIPLERIPGYAARHRVRPGLTGLAQVYAPRDIPRRQKFRYDLLYIRRQSFWLDLKLIALSFWITFRGKWESRAQKV